MANKRRHPRTSHLYPLHLSFLDTPTCSLLQVDVLVNTPVRGLHLEAGAVSSSLLKAAGPVLQDECHQKAPDGIEFGETVTTSGGNLKCAVVVHAACCDWSEGSDKCKEVAT